MTTKTRNYYPILFSAFMLLSGCDQFKKILPPGTFGDDDDNSPVPVVETPEEIKEPEDTEEKVDDSDPSLRPQDTRVTRRLTLELSQRLPSKSEMEGSKENDFDVEAFIDKLLALPESNHAIALWHKQIFQWHNRKETSLHNFLAAGDSTLPVGFDESTIIQIGDEPIDFFRYLLQEELTLKDAFSGRLTVLNSNLIDEYGLSSVGQAFNLSSKAFAYYPDSRPALGILAQNGFHSFFTKPYTGNDMYRAFEIYRWMSCSSLYSQDAHLFYDLSDEELATNYSTLSNTKTECASCHQQYTDFSTFINQFSEPASFENWKSINTATSLSGRFKGERFEDIEGLASIIADSRDIENCYVKRVISDAIKSPMVQFDKEDLYVQAITDFHANGYKLRSLYRSFLRSTEFLQNTSQTYSKKNRAWYLNRRHWEGIVQQLLGKNHSLTLDDTLDMNHNTAIYQKLYVPDYSYVRAAVKLVGSLSSAIVENELVNTSNPFARILFTLTPTTNIETMNETQIKVQIAELWFLLTGYELGSENVHIGRLYQLFTESLVDNSRTEHLLAWETLLNAIFLSPEFLTY